MYVASFTQLKIVDFIKRCGEKDKLVMLILKNIEEFNPAYIDIEKKLKNSSLAQKIEFKIYAYNFSDRKEIEYVAKYIEYEQPDIILILSNSPIEGFNRKLFENLQERGDILIVKIGQDKNKLNGNNIDSIYDAIFSNEDEAIEFFEKACSLLKPKRKPQTVMQVENVDDFFKNIPQFNQIGVENMAPSDSANTAPTAGNESQKSEKDGKTQEISEANLLLLIEVLKDLRDSLEELKEKVEQLQEQQRQSTSGKKEAKVEKKEKASPSGYNIVNILTIALLLVLIGIILVYK
jgi:hypothetical protein